MLHGKFSLAIERHLGIYLGIQADDTREKCDVFPNYYFVSVKSIVDDEETIVKPVPVSIVVCKHCILSIQYTSNVHTLRVLQRFKTQQGRSSRFHPLG